MNSTLKITVPIVILMAVVFGVTFFAQYTPRTPDDDPDAKGPDTAATELPLRFANATRMWDPPDTISVVPPHGIRYRGFPLSAPSANPAKSYDNDGNPFEYSLQDRTFPAFFEPGEKLYGTSFWFENRNTRPVVIQLKSVSCVACSGGRIAPIPPPVTRQLLQMSAVGCLPQGLFNCLSLGMGGPAANLQPERLVWEQHLYKEEKNPSYTVPAANDTDGWSPQWGILELQFKVMAASPKAIGAEFAMHVEGSDAAVPAKFAISFEGVNPFEVSPARIDVGELTGNSDARNFELLVFSSTRGPERTGVGEPGDLLPPKVDVRMVGGGPDSGMFVTVSPPVRVPQQELLALTDQLVRQVGKPIRVESAYRIGVHLTPNVGKNKIDIGLLERDIWVAASGASERRVRLTGLVRGPVWLDNDRTDIDLLAYRSRDGISNQRFRLIAEEKAAKVAVVGVEGDAADFLKVALEEQPPIGDYGQFDLKLTVAPNARTGAWSGVIVLEVKGPMPQRIRIPVKGRGQL